MCQCLPCECWWCNCCGACAGLGEVLCCIGFWCCKPEELKAHSPDCCYCFETSGCGGNCFCYGGICCAPKWLQNYSNSIKK